MALISAPWYSSIEDDKKSAADLFSAKGHFGPLSSEAVHEHLNLYAGCESL